jgi:hypothetical protein
MFCFYFLANFGLNSVFLSRVGFETELTGTTAGGHGGQTTCDASGCKSVGGGHLNFLP